MRARPRARALARAYALRRRSLSRACPRSARRRAARSYPVEYSVSPADIFSIGTSSGVLRVNGTALDYEEQAEYALQVLAYTVGRESEPGGNLFAPLFALSALYGFSNGGTNSSTQALIPELFGSGGREQAVAMAAGSFASSLGSGTGYILPMLFGANVRRKAFLAAGAHLRQRTARYGGDL